MDWLKTTSCAAFLFVLAVGAKADMIRNDALQTEPAAPRAALPTPSDVAGEVFKLRGVQVAGGAFRESSAAKELPAPPDSAAMVLGAFGGLGVWQLGRSARKLHFGQVPEWFHAEGPERIGHSVAARPDLVLDVSVSEYNRPLEAVVPNFALVRRDVPAILIEHIILSVEGPRAPPVCG